MEIRYSVLGFGIRDWNMKGPEFGLVQESLFKIECFGAIIKDDLIFGLNRGTGGSIFIRCS